MYVRQVESGSSEGRATALGGFDRKGCPGGSRTSFSGDGQEWHALRQPLLLGGVFPKQRDRSRSGLPRFGHGRPLVRRESDCMIGCNGVAFLSPAIPIPSAQM